MSGLVKAKKYDWKDSNMALFGSDTEKQVKKESAESEPAWKGAGQTVGLQIWRINKFKVENWAKEEYGQFFNGDSYIILNTYKDQDSDELHYDVHFWIGRYSTQDEYGTAAYKTVELDTLLDDKPVQHREVEGHESQLFKSYFSEIRTMSGGADSGFRHVGPKEVKTRLLHFKKTGRKVVITEIEKRCRSKLTSGDVFILQTADCLYQWNGKDCSKDEKFRAVQTLQEMYSAKSGLIPKETLDEDDTAENHKFYTYLDEEDDGDDDQDAQVEMEPKLFKVSDADGSLDMDPVKEGDISMDDFDPNDVMIVDAGDEVTVWIGSGASEAEKKNGLSYAHNYLKQTDRCWPSITVYKEGQVGNRTIPGVA